MDPKTLKGAATSGTGISGAVLATLALVPMWLPVITQHEPVTPELITQTMTVLTAWLVLVFGRRAIAKNGPAQ